MTLSKIVIGVDFSPESERAIAHAMSIARHAGAAVTLVHVGVVPASEMELPDNPWSALGRERLAADRAALAELRERLSGQGVEISHVVADGFPDTALADVARELHAGLVVVGTHGRTGVKRLLLGSVAEKTVRLADRSVLVVRGAAPPAGYRNVIVGMDYSDTAWCAVDRALEVAAPDATLRVVHAWRGPYVELDIDGRVFEQLRAAAEAVARKHRERLRGMTLPPGVSIHLEVVDGAPFEALDELSASADLVVVGSHGYRGLRRFLLGSVAEATVRHARCSVLVAR